MGRSEKVGKVTARVLGGAVAAVGLGTQSLDTLLTAYDVATRAKPDADFATTGQEAFEVEMAGQVWRYRVYLMRHGGKRYACVALDWEPA